jgi:hypothetical protein
MFSFILPYVSKLQVNGKKMFISRSQLNIFRLGLVAEAFWLEGTTLSKNDGTSWRLRLWPHARQAVRVAFGGEGIWWPLDSYVVRTDKGVGGY